MDSRILARDVLVRLVPGWVIIGGVWYPASQVVLYESQATGRPR